MSTALEDWSDAITAAVPTLADIKPSVENELLAMAVFDVLQRRRMLPTDAVFIGGTALRLCYGSPRFSEDLDFHTPEYAPRSLDRECLAREVAALVGCEISVSTPMAVGRSTLARISAVVPGRPRSERRPRMKIDLGTGTQIDTGPAIVTLRMAGGLLPGMGDVGDMFSFTTSSKEEIYADKHLALVGRARRIKHRDLFDIMWLQHQGVAFRPDLLAAKVPAQGRESFVALLRQRAETGKNAIASGAYQAEMQRFLPGNSSWLFDERGRRDGMAGGFETLVLDNAKAVDRALSRIAVAKEPLGTHTAK